MPKKIHIGELIRVKLKEDRRSVEWLANEISCVRDNVYKITRKKSIDADLLLRISLALETDLFQYYSELYSDLMKEKSVNTGQDSFV